MNSRDFSAFFNHPYFTQIVEFDDNSKRVCIVTPATDDDMKILPEGDRYNPTLRVISQSPLHLRELFHFGAARYRIITEPFWSHYGYYDCLATRYEGSQTNDSEGFEIT